MKRTLTLLFLAVFALTLTAHPAKKVGLKIDQDAKALSIMYFHQVKDNKDHFIKKVTVELNGKKVIEQDLSLQDDTKEGTLSYRIPEMKPGDEIRVNTECNKGGKKNASIKVTADKKVKVKKGETKSEPKAVKEKPAEGTFKSK